MKARWRTPSEWLREELQNTDEKKPNPKLIGAIVYFQGVAGVFLFGGGALILGYQIYFWMKTAQWEAMPLVKFMSPEDVERLSHPRDWVGLAHIVLKLLQAIPLSLACSLLGLWLFTRTDKVDTQASGQ